VTLEARNGRACSPLPLAGRVAARAPGVDRAGRNLYAERMIVKRLEANEPTVIPAELLAQLGLRAGDQIALDVVGDKIVVASAADYPDVFVNNFSTFTEWSSEADAEAFDNL
jgi:antitoxin component of MazEF toxin-antitoxin module